MSHNNYPVEILPQPDWRKGITGDEIRSLQDDAVVARRIDCVKSDAIDDIFNLLTDVGISRRRLLNLSTCLLGGKFKLEHFGFSQHEQGDLSWEQGNSISLDIVVEPNYKEEKGPWFVVGWKISSVDGIEIPYKRTYASQKDYDNAKIYVLEYKNLPQAENGNGRVADCAGSLRITHDPVNLNYWHFTIDIYPQGETTPLNNAKSKWQEAILDNIEDIIRHTYIVIPDELEPSDINGIETLIQNKA